MASVKIEVDGAREIAVDMRNAEPILARRLKPAVSKGALNVKNDLAAACISKGRRPSVETSMHNAIDYAFVIHLHPTAVNGLMCANNVESDLRRLFGDKALYIPYTDPGYVLFKLVEESIVAYRTAHGAEPQVIWLQNHGIFVAANTTTPSPVRKPDISLSSALSV